jgi:hypothetical protein
MAAVIDGNFLIRQSLGLPAVQDILQGSSASPLDLNKMYIISGVGATRTLLSYESGATCFFDRAAGVVYTLPTPQAGLWYNFITSNAASVTAGAGIFLQGVVTLGIVSAATTLAVAGNGTSHITMASNGSTTGGVIGSMTTFVGLDSTHWYVSGFLSGSGTLATPFA